MKSLLVLLSLCLTQSLFAQQKHTGKILLDTTNYKIEQIDINQYNSYINGSSHHSGLDTLDNGTVVKCYSPYTDDILYVTNKNQKQGLMNELALFHAEDTTVEKLTYPVFIPQNDYDITFVRWLFAKSAIVRLKSIKDGGYSYLLISFKNI